MLLACGLLNQHSFQLYDLQESSLLLNGVNPIAISSTGFSLLPNLLPYINSLISSPMKMSTFIFALLFSATNINYSYWMPQPSCVIAFTKFFMRPSLDVKRWKEDLLRMNHWHMVHSVPTTYALMFFTSIFYSVITVVVMAVPNTQKAHIYLVYPRRREISFK